MSGSTPEKAEKTMSSRLLTMKFMQRAAASAATKEPQNPAEEESQRTSKRARLSTDGTTSATPQSDLEAISAALAAEEEKRREAVARQAAEAGESEWVLDIPATNFTPQPIVLSADSLDAEGDRPQGGRRAYGNFVRKKPDNPVVVKAPEEFQIEDESEDEPSPPDPADPDAVAAYHEQIRLKALAREERRKAAMAKAERKRLSGLTSISGSQKPSSPRLGASHPTKKKKKRKF